MSSDRERDKRKEMNSQSHTYSLLFLHSSLYYFATILFIRCNFGKSFAIVVFSPSLHLFKSFSSFTFLVCLSSRKKMEIILVERLKVGGLQIKKYSQIFSQVSNLRNTKPKKKKQQENGTKTEERQKWV